PGQGLTGFNAVDTKTLGSAVAKSPAEKVLVILDTCYSGRGAGEVAEAVAKVLGTRPAAPGRQKAVAVIASAHALDKAQEGVFGEALVHVLANPSVNRRWSDEDSFIHTEFLAAAVADELEARGIAQRPGYKADGLGQDFVPNPRHRPGILAEDVETRRRRLEAAEEHFLPAARGIEVGETGWDFPGRERLVRDVISWLATARSGMLVVTGPPGAGKSAVMGRLATMSDPHYRERARAEGGLATIPPETLPPEGVVDVALHGRGKTFAGFVAALGQGLGISTPAQKTLEAKY